MTWEQRWHPLREEWVVVAAHRQDRPWTGTHAPSDHPPPAPTYDAECYLCPGNTRVGGQTNPRYTGTFIFDNDHACVGPDAPDEISTPGPPFRSRRATGMSRVLCYSPRHDATMSSFTADEIEAVISVWGSQFVELAGYDDVASVLVFENKGELTGVSNTHPHGQIYATNFVFKLFETEARVSADYFRDQRMSLLESVIAAELRDGRRVIFENDSAVVFVPWFARYAYEAYVAPKACHPHAGALSRSERRDLAEAMLVLVRAYDHLWEMPFPYVMALHQAPTDGSIVDAFHFHIEFHPPLRKPNLIKHLAGPEIGGGNFIADTAPEATAAELREAARI